MAAVRRGVMAIACSSSSSTSSPLCRISPGPFHRVLLHKFRVAGGELRLLGSKRKGGHCWDSSFGTSSLCRISPGAFQRVPWHRFSSAGGELMVECPQAEVLKRKGKGGQCRVSSFSSSSKSSEAPGNGRRPSSQRPRLESFFATCPPGLEEVVAAELRAPTIGASRVQVGSAGVAFCGTKRNGVLANLWLRSATRVLLELASGPLSRGANSDPVYEFVRRAVDWPALLVVESAPSAWPRVRYGAKDVRGVERIRRGGSGDGVVERNWGWKFRTFSVSSRVWDCEGVTSSMFASVRGKDAICDAVRDACRGCRPDPPEDGSSSADLPLFLSLYRDRAVLYRDMTGTSLHKRGYRDAMHRAGLNEAIAAAMLTVAGWNRWLPEIQSSNKGLGADSGVLLDPMCGSGTLLIEAALMAINSAPGLMRPHWPFETWHDFSPFLLKSCRQDAIAAEVSPPQGLRILGNDIHEGALSLCMKDAEAANVRSMLELSCQDCRDYSPQLLPSLVVVNPPWGARLGDSSDSDDYQALLTTWQALGRFLKAHCSQADVYVLSGNSSVTHAMHMKADKKWPVSVGGIDCRIMHYHVLPPKSPRSSDSLVAVGSI